MSHTPAPWFFTYAQRGYVIVNKQNTYDIAVVRNVGNENNEANARLIAAAPELLEALLLIDPSGKFEKWQNAQGKEIGPQIAAAIAKAGGAA